MRRTGPTWIALALLLAALPAAAAPAPSAGEIAVEAPSPYRSRAPQAAALEDGRFVVVWENMREGLWARVLDAEGGSVGEQRLLVANSPVPANPGEGWWTTHHDGAVAPLPDGGFLLLWTTELSWARNAVFHFDSERIASDIFARRFDAAGLPVGPQRQLNRETAGFQSDVRAVVMAPGRVLALWRDDRRGGRIHGRVLTEGGQRAGRERIFANRGATWPAAAANAHGDVLFAWGAPNGNGGDVHAQLLDADLAPVTRIFRVNTTAARHQGEPAVAAGADGGFLVTWRGELTGPRSFRNFSQAINAAGAPVGAEGRVGEGLWDADLTASVVAQPGGGYLAFWMGWKGFFSEALYARELGTDGAPRGDALRVNEETVIPAHRLGFAAKAGRAVVAWEGFEGKERGIQARVLVLSSP